MTGKFNVHLTALSALLLAACGTESTSVAELPANCTTRTTTAIGGPISLIDETGTAVTEADFKGNPTLVYFGFTYCPDVCPMTLVTMARAIDELPQDLRNSLQTVLVSIDPSRDTPEAMQSYVSTEAFPDGLKGLTGSQEDVAAAAQAFRAGFQRVEDPDSTAGYTMDHTSIVYLMDADWKLLTFFTHESTSEDMAACLAYHLSD